MANLPEFYCTEVHKNSKYFANISVVRRLKVGDYGFVKNGIYEHRGNIQDLKSFKVHLKISKNTSLPINSSSKGVKKSKISPKANVNGLFDVGVEINFKKAQSYFLNASEGSKSESLDNVDEVAVELLRLINLNKWNKNYVFINEVVSAKYTTLLISSESDNSVQITGQAKLKEFSFGDLGAKIHHTSQKSLSTTILAKPKWTPLFYGIQLQQSIFSKFLRQSAKSSDIRRKRMAMIRVSKSTGKKLKASDCFKRV